MPKVCEDGQMDVLIHAKATGRIWIKCSSEIYSGITHRVVTFSPDKNFCEYHTGELAGKI